MGICRNSSVRPDRMFTPEEAKESVLNTVKDIVSMEKYNDAVVTIPCRDKNCADASERMPQQFHLDAGK